MSSDSDSEAHDSTEDVDVEDEVAQQDVNVNNSESKTSDDKKSNKLNSVDRILHHVVEGDVDWYVVQWTDCEERRALGPLEDVTWEKLTNLTHCQKKIDDFWRKTNKQKDKLFKICQEADARHDSILRRQTKAATPRDEKKRKHDGVTPAKSKEKVEQPKASAKRAKMAANEPSEVEPKVRITKQSKKLTVNDAEVPARQSAGSSSQISGQHSVGLSPLYLRKLKPGFVQSVADSISSTPQSEIVGVPNTFVRLYMNEYQKKNADLDQELVNEEIRNTWEKLQPATRKFYLDQDAAGVGNSSGGSGIASKGSGGSARVAKKSFPQESASSRVAQKQTNGGDRRLQMKGPSHSELTKPSAAPFAPYPTDKDKFRSNTATATPAASNNSLEEESEYFKCKTCFADFFLPRSEFAVHRCVAPPKPKQLFCRYCKEATYTKEADLLKHETSFCAQNPAIVSQRKAQTSPSSSGASRFANKPSHFAGNERETESPAYIPAISVVNEDDGNDVADTTTNAEPTSGDGDYGVDGSGLNNEDVAISAAIQEPFYADAYLAESLSAGENNNVSGAYNDEVALE